MPTFATGFTDAANTRTSKNLIPLQIYFLSFIITRVARFSLCEYHLSDTLFTACIDFYFIYTKTFLQMKFKTERKWLLKGHFSYLPTGPGPHALLSSAGHAHTERDEIRRAYSGEERAHGIGGVVMRQNSSRVSMGFPGNKEKMLDYRHRSDSLSGENASKEPGTIFQFAVRHDQHVKGPGTRNYRKLQGRVMLQ